MPNTRRSQRQTITKKQPNNPLITAAELSLSHRNFTDTKTYALRAQESDPTHPSPPKLLSIASVLSTRPISPTGSPDYYTLLNLSPFEASITKIKNSFKNLTNNLNPNTNTFPFSAEAFEMVLKAWAVLSDPIEKAKFDNELMGNNNNTNNTFWTVCPYCYYVYEYEKMYVDCCIRCSNEKCRRGFSSVAVKVPPPKDVIEEGRYKCGGFLPVDGVAWVPFVAVGKNEEDCEDDGFIIDVSDGENVVEGNGNGKKAKTGCEGDNVFVVDGIEMNWDECLDVIGEEMSGSGIAFYEGKDDLFVGLDDFVG